MSQKSIQVHCFSGDKSHFTSDFYSFHWHSWTESLQYYVPFKNGLLLTGESVAATGTGASDVLAEFAEFLLLGAFDLVMLVRLFIAVSSE